MVISCPKCKFSATHTDPSRLTPDRPPRCPRCQSIIPLTRQQEQSFGYNEVHQRQFQRFSWEHRSSWLDLGAFWRTSVNILFSPSDAFASLNYEAGIRNSLVFVMVYGSLGHIIGRYWFTLLGIHYGILQANTQDNVLRFAIAALFTPIMLLMCVGLASSLIHLFMRLLGAARKTFSATFQVTAYVTGATSLANVFPVLGSFFVPIWGLILSCIGLAVVHHTSKTRVLFAILLPLILAALMISGVVLVAAVSGILELLHIIHQYF